MKIKLTRLTAAVVIFVASIAVAQVTRTQTGRALDASLRVGSGRNNTGSTLGKPINSQLYITGQVSGLSNFRGQVNYFSGNQLHLDLPSASLGDFRRKSIGLSQVQGGASFRTTPYYQRTRTALTAGGIMSGIAAKGSSIPMTSLSTPLAQKLYVDATKGYTGLMSTRPKGILGTVPPTQSALGATTGTGVTGLAGVADGQSAGQFGLLQDRKRQDLASELYKLNMANNAQTNQKVQAKIEAAIHGRVKPFEQQTLPPLPKGSEEPPPDESSPSAWSDRQAIPGMPTTGEDKFTDIMLQLKDRKERIEALQREKTREPEDANSPETTSGSDEQAKPLAIDSLAGLGKDYFNRCLVKAEKLLTGGEYYKAASEYETAAAVNPSNPLARTGLCQAYFAAGEPMTAAVHLRRAFQLFPPLMKTPIKIEKMIGSRIFRQRLKNLDKTIAASDRDNVSLVLLATFMHFNTGRWDQAIQYAKTLKRLSKDDNLLAAYADYILTGDLVIQKPKPALGVTK